MQGKISIKSIFVQNLLSFGWDGVVLNLEPLNVFVGPNGSGKSNFVEVFRLFQAASDDLTQPLTKGGGGEHWQFKGIGYDSEPCIISLETPAKEGFIYTNELSLLEHDMEFFIVNSRPYMRNERIFLLEAVNYNDLLKTSQYELRPSDGVYAKSHDFYSFTGKAHGAVIAQFSESGVPPRFIRREIKSADLKIDQSILSQRSDPDTYPYLKRLTQLYKGIHLFTENVFGRSSPARLPQDAALDNSFLFPDASNLALVLNDLQNQPPVMKTIIEKLKLFYERAENIITRVQGGTVQIFFQEEGLTQTVPASRLSDGTLRYLCLLVILCHPTPPPLICIEEPELGMHPDVLPTIAELLIEASQRTQLIITTHSDLLVSAIGAKHPEAIVVCEKGDNGTTMKRLEPEKMQEWLTRYSLGDLWLKGEIGGTRW